MRAREALSNGTPGERSTASTIEGIAGVVDCVPDSFRASFACFSSSSHDAHFRFSCSLPMFHCSGYGSGEESNFFGAAPALRRSPVWESDRVGLMHDVLVSIRVPLQPARAGRNPFAPAEALWIVVSYSTSDYPPDTWKRNKIERK